MLGIYDDDDDESSSESRPSAADVDARLSKPVPSALPGPQESVSSSTETESSSSDSGSSVYQDVGTEESSADEEQGAARSDADLRFSLSMRDSGYGTADRGSTEALSFIGACQDIDALLPVDGPPPESFEEFERAVASEEVPDQRGGRVGGTGVCRPVCRLLAPSEEERRAAKRNLSLFINESSSSGSGSSDSSEDGSTGDDSRPPDAAVVDPPDAAIHKTNAREEAGSKEQQGGAGTGKVSPPKCVVCPMCGTDEDVDNL
ncbi:hypothetical protein FJT64_027620 [Amphibalanus amphitrite]|uniref:Uncharacterized protein n=1 Tax=Amphibalanus amphitrite TaxID=1232801 RepID=A0A6A4WCM0_AMPAM|nr:hypothetical protein FJT64_027620 [Amphibalanus amphitrite]